ncbi:MAG: hypothetical protein A2168_07275 [Planctomycetes bacterium RBG_13_50_24]|nr:MAG: hypothetical protein A2168_07275 [Planctomycetes bacterium RBG_13_50_24]
MILCGLWIYFELNFFHLDKTAKKGYNSYIISFQEKSFGSSPGLFQGFFFRYGAQLNLAGTSGLGPEGCMFESCRPD